MRWLRGMVAATATLAAVMGAMVVTTSSAAAYPAGCTNQPELRSKDELQPGRALCNGNYLLRMQENGDLVLREISTGRACWHSNTFAPYAVATFEGGYRNPTGDSVNPKLKIGQRVIEGANTTWHVGSTANLNSKGEFWIGYRQVKTTC